MSRLSAVWILESTQMRFVPLCVQMELSWEENLSIFPVKKTRCTVCWDESADFSGNMAPDRYRADGIMQGD